MVDIQIHTQVKTDCFAWQKTRRNCSALKEIVCKKGPCPFYKPKKTVKDYPYNT